MEPLELEALMTVQRGREGRCARMGADRLRLLEAVRDHGSISAAARAVGLSYKAAWDGVHAMNNLFGSPLVAGQTGGKRGGGATLTQAGEEVLSAFSSVEAELARFAARLEARFSESATQISPASFRSLMMKTSARNMFRCTVENIADGAVNSEVLLDLTDGQRLAAIVTKQSVADLGLEEGAECLALIKSSFVILAPEDGLSKTSARNRLCGTVIAHDDGAVNSEITLDLGGGKTLAAIITKDSADALRLKPGDRACALIKASHVILAVE